MQYHYRAKNLHMVNNDILQFDNERMASAHKEEWVTTSPTSLWPIPAPPSSLSIKSSIIKAKITTLKRVRV